MANLSRRSRQCREWKFAVKRIIDYIVSCTLLLFLFPLLLLIALLIKLSSKGPALFLQERIGQNGRPFLIYKFSTMVVGAETIGKGYEVTHEDSRVTPIGKWLRRTSFDELPQLLNIFKGEMSLIGPRPTLRYQVEQYSEEERRRLLVKPGVTGLAQVKGRNAISWEERIKWDLYYIDHYSFWLDFTIFLKTFKVWITGKGLYTS